MCSLIYVTGSVKTSLIAQDRKFDFFTQTPGADPKFGKRGGGGGGHFAEKSGRAKQKQKKGHNNKLVIFYQIYYITYVM